MSEPAAVLEDEPRARRRSLLPFLLVGLVALVAAGAYGAFSLFAQAPDPDYSVAVSLTPPTSSNRVVFVDGMCPGDRGNSVLPEADFEPYGSRSLEGIFAPRQVVAYQFLLTASDEAAQAGSVDFDVSWDEGSNREGGINPAAGLVCSFVDASDPLTDEAIADARVRARKVADVEGQYGSGFSVSGIDPGESVVVEAWLVTRDSVPDITGSFQVRLDALEAENVELVNDGVLTYRMTYFDQFESAQLQLGMADPEIEGVDRTRVINYELTVTNPSTVAVASGVSLADVFDPSTTLRSEIVVEDSQGFPTICEPSADGFTCDLGYLNPSEKVTLRAAVDIGPNAQEIWSREDGDCDDTFVDLCNRAVLSWKQGPARAAQVEAAEPTDLPSSAQDISLTKLSDETNYYLGEPVEFTYVVNNLIGQPLFEVLVTDEGCAPVEFIQGDLDANGLLDSGENWTYTCSIRSVEADQATSQSSVQAITEDDRAVFTRSVHVLKIVAPAVTTRPLVDAANGEARFAVEVAGNDNLRDLTAIPLAGCGAVGFVGGDNDGNGVLAEGETWIFGCVPDGAARPVMRIYATDSKDNSVTARSDLIGE